MDRRPTGTNSLRNPRGGIKRPPPPATIGSSKIARLAGRKQRNQPLGPRRGGQPDDSRSSVPHFPSINSSLENTQSEPSSARTSILNRPSFIATATERHQRARTIVDNRPIRDPEFQRASIRSIVQYLTSHDYGPINVGALRNMENRTFQQVFKFLHLRVIPEYIYPERFPDVFIEILKGLKYPRTETLSVRALYSVAAPHSYPAFLAVLSWMVDLCKSNDRIESYYANLDQEEEEDRSEDANILFFDYSVATYKAFLNGADSFEEYDQKLTALLDGLNTKYNESAKKVSDENERLQEQLVELKSAPDLREKYLEKRAKMEKDMIKFEEYNNDMRKKIAKHTESIARTQRELQLLEAQHASVKDEYTEMERVLQSYNTSLEEINRLNDEQTALEKEYVNSQLLSEKLAKEQNIHENELSRQIVKTEKLGKEYNAQLSELGIADTTEGNNLFFELDPKAENLAQMCSVDLIHTAQPYLEKLKQQYETLFNRASERMAEAHKRLSALTEQVTEQQATVVLRKENLDKATYEYEAERQRFFRETEKINAEMEQKELDMKRKKREAKERLYTYQKHEQELKLMTTEYKAKAAARRQQIIQEGTKRLAKVQTVRKRVEELAKQFEEQLELI